MKIYKRDGRIVDFDSNKIRNAVNKANDSALAEHKIPDDIIESIVENVVNKCMEHSSIISVEEVQDLVEREIMASNNYEVAKSYITYRYTHNLIRQKNTTDDKILSIVDLVNQEAKEENSNKNPVINSTQRDYMAGEVSRDLAERVLLPKDVVDAHKLGVIHFHDSDYFANKEYNCCLCNLEDMLQNGTVITGTLIEKPHTFSTACNITTQIIAQVASNQYGGQSITLTHLAPFVDISRKKIRKIVEGEMAKVKEATGTVVDETTINEMVEARLRDEIKKGIQTIQYQVVTLLTTNGQAPFITVFMYLGETDEYKDELAMIIEEFLNQRIKGMKNRKGVYVTQAFPKLIYALEEDNITEDSKYWYLTELSAKCTAKRMVPDYISEKVMRKLKEGNCFPSMGCRSFLAPFKDKNNNYKFYGRSIS